MMKWLGLLLVVCSGGGIGFLYAMRLRQERTNLERLCQMLREIAVQIAFRSLTVQELLEQLCRETAYAAFQFPVTVLSGMEQKTARWYYLSAIANNGLGNNVVALDHARRAASMQPGNMEYRALVQQLEGGSGWYDQMSTPYGGMSVMGNDFCCRLCLANMLCNLCCFGGRGGMLCC